MVKVVLALLVLAAPAFAQPVADASAVLREGNTAATAGDWAKVTTLVDPLFVVKLAPPDLAEAHRLAGLAAFFQQRQVDAEAHFLAYLRLDLDGRLELSLYPPEVVQFFEGVRARHAAELHARSRKQVRYWWVSPIPVVSQYQNGEHGKAFVVGGLLGAFAIANVTSYLVLRSWCTQVSGGTGESATCDDHGNHVHAANELRGINITSGIGIILTALYGVYDGVSGYREKQREEALQLYMSPTTNGSVLGITGTF